MITRRSFLGGISPPPHSSECHSRFSRSAHAATTLSLSVINSTGRFREQHDMGYIVGSDLATGNQAFSRGDGVLRPSRCRTTVPMDSPIIRFPFEATEAPR